MSSRSADTVDGGINEERQMMVNKQAPEEDSRGELLLLRQINPFGTVSLRRTSRLMYAA